MSAAVLREAAKLMRSRAEAVSEPWHCWGDDSLPERSGTEAWKSDMDGYLGGEWGEYAASWHPLVALAAADWLEQVAVSWHLYEGHAIRNTALVVARTYLGGVS